MARANNGHILQALGELGRDAEARTLVLSALKAFELSTGDPNGRDIREEVTGPILDALYVHAGQITKELRSGLKLTFRHRGKILRDFILSKSERPDHVWEPQTTRVLLDLARNARNVVIGGAYIGDHAILIGNAIKNHGGLCHCFEIDDENLGYLRHNANQNSLSNLLVSKLALWDENDIKLRVVGADAYASTVSAPDAQDGVSTVTLNRYGHDRGVGNFDLIMLDIEGGELNALLGAKRYLSMEPDTAPHLVFEVHSSYVDFSAGLPGTPIIKTLSKLGYQAFAIRDYHSNVDMTDQPIEIVDLDSVYLSGPPHGFNIVAVKRREVLDSYRLTHGVSPKLLTHKDPALHAPLS